VILNLMPLKEDTELDLLRVLSNFPIQTEISFMKVSTYKSTHTSSTHLNAFYLEFKDVQEDYFDGFIITGAPVEKMDFSEVEYWKELEEIMKSLEEAKQKALALEAKDEEVFLPLSKAYSLPRETEEEQKIYRETMENCLIEASLVPTELLELCLEKIPLFARLQERGSRIALSDVGVGAGFLKTAMESAILNVYINTKSMQNREIKAKREAVCDRARTGISSLEEIIQAVENVVRGA